MIGVNTITSLLGDKNKEINTIPPKPKIIVSPWNLHKNLNYNYHNQFF